VFKTGTTRWHGSANDRYINKDLIHRTRLEQLPRVNPFTYHEISATTSGPVYIPKVYNGKDKTFWLFGFQRHHEKGGETANLAVPSPEMLAGNFNFGGLNQIYDPASTAFGANPLCQPAGSECWYRTPFPNNQVPQARWDPAVKNFLSHNPYVPENNTQRAINAASGPTNNLISPTNYRSYRTRFDAKIDQQFSATNKMFGRYSQVRHRSWRDRLSPEIAWRDYDWRAVPIPIDQRNVVLSDTWSISPTTINEARFGSSRRRRTIFPSTIGQNWAKQLGIPNVGPETFPNFQSCNNQSNCTGGTTYFRQDNSGLSASQDVGEDFTIQDNLTKVIDRHTLKFGYEVIRTRYNSLAPALPSGTYRFGATDFPFRPNAGNTFAAFLLGSVSNAEFTQAVTTWLPRWWSHAWYIQDDFKPFPNVTLNLGLRWSYESPYNTKYGGHSQFDPNAIDPITGRRGAILHPKGPLSSRDLNNFQPRVGLAWQIKPSLLFRSSFGMITQDAMANGLNQNFEEYFATAAVQAPPGDPRPVFYLSQGPQPFRFNIAPDGSVPFVGSNFANRNASWMDPNFRMPYIMNWSGGFQYEFSHNWVVEAIYQGTAGVGLLNNWDINTIPLNFSTDPALLNQIFQATQNYKPYPQFGTVKLYSNFGHSTYHSGTLRVERRFTSGITLLGLYTLAKALDESDDDGTASGVTYYNRRLEKGRAGYDIRHRYMSVLSYELPVGKGRRFLNRGGVLNQALGGWDIIWPLTLQSGPPATVTFAGSANKYLPQGVSRPNVLSPDYVTPNWDIGSNRFPTSAQNPYLQFSAFAYPAAFTAGTLGRNTFTGPGMNWMQLGLAKTFDLGERLKLQLRVEGNNFPFKRPELLLPNAAYNANSANLFGTFTSLRQPFSEAGQSRPHIVVGGRIEF